MQNNLQEFQERFLENLQMELENYKRPELNTNSEGK